MDVLAKLAGGDRRSIGRANEVVADVLADPALFAVVFGGMLADDPLIRMRAADVSEKVTARHPEYLRPFKGQLLQGIAASGQQEVRWHVAQMLPRLELRDDERASAVALLTGYLDDPGSIVRTAAMQALADLAAADVALRPTIIPLLEECTGAGSPAMRSRGRKLLRQLGAGG